MCSNMYHSNANSDSFGDNWEEEFWANMLSPSQLPSQHSEDHVNISATQTILQVSVQNNLSIETAVSQTQQTSFAPASQYSTLLSPTWDESLPRSTVQNRTPMSTNMSSYFSSFDPLAQPQDITTNHVPVFQTTNSTKTHYTQKTFVSSKNGVHATVMKRKRKRTVFTTEQVEALEEVFAKKPYVTRNERQTLVEKLQVKDKSVKIWFQNRRLKIKREDEQYESLEYEYKANIYERLNSVESKIFERVDESGYVTLDETVMSELVNVIDDYFANKTPVVEAKQEIQSSPIYEPISPASSDENDCNSTWEHPHTESIMTQGLMDLESIMSM